jgi:hypothetical protein
MSLWRRIKVAGGELPDEHESIGTLVVRCECEG